MRQKITLMHGVRRVEVMEANSERVCANSTLPRTNIRLYDRQIHRPRNDRSRRFCRQATRAAHLCEALPLLHGRTKGRHGFIARYCS